MLKLLFITNFLLIACVYAQYNPLAGISTCSREVSLIPTCNRNKRYSEIDGSCNNLVAPWVGKASTPFKRYFANTYDDSFNAPRRRASNGAPLKNPRVISRMLSLDPGQSEAIYSHFIAIFGQFLAHDLTLANSATGLTPIKRSKLVYYSYNDSEFLR